MFNRLYCPCLELLTSPYSFSRIFLLFCEGCWKWDKEWFTRWGSTIFISSCWSKSQVFVIGKQGTHSTILTSFCVCISEAVWAPLNLPALVTENLSNPPDRIFWKAILLLPSDHDSVSNLEDRWADKQMFDDLWYFRIFYCLIWSSLSLHASIPFSPPQDPIGLARVKVQWWQGVTVKWWATLWYT